MEGRPTPEQVLAALTEHGSIRAACRATGWKRSSVQDKIAEWSGQDPALASAFRVARQQAQHLRPATGQRATSHRDADGVTHATSGPLPSRPGSAEEAEAYLRQRWGLPADRYVCVSVTANEWEGPVAGGGSTTFAQVKGSFRPIADYQLLYPATHVPPLVKPARVRRASDAPRLYVVEGDHQAPYHDLGLHEVSCAFLRDTQPDEHVYLGDTLDLPTISRHPDHPAAMATPQECVQTAYRLLRDKREAAPNARTRKLKGNHDWRIEGEQLARAERMAVLAPADVGDGAQVPGHSLRRLLHLDAIGVELVEDARGWEHGEVELVPGCEGLVVRHGWLTGANTAAKTLAKRGRSILVGHGHGREHVWGWDPGSDTMRQASMIAAMCRVDGVFPHFTVLPGWAQGFATVTVWPSGRFVIEHACYVGGVLYWRDRAWRASDAVLDEMREQSWAAMNPSASISDAPPIAA